MFILDKMSLVISREQLELSLRSYWIDFQSIAIRAIMVFHYPDIKIIFHHSCSNSSSNSSSNNIIMSLRSYLIGPYPVFVKGFIHCSNSNSHNSNSSSSSSSMSLCLYCISVHPMLVVRGTAAVVVSVVVLIAGCHYIIIESACCCSRC